MVDVLAILGDRSEGNSIAMHAIRWLQGMPNTRRLATQDLLSLAKWITWKVNIGGEEEGVYSRLVQLSDLGSHKVNITEIESLMQDKDEIEQRYGKYL